MPDSVSKPQHRVGGDLFADRWLLARFSVIYAVAWGTLLWVIDSEALEFLRAATAQSAGALLNAAGARVAVSGCYLTAASGVTVVSGRCMPLQAMALAIALVMSSRRITWPGRAMWTLISLGLVLAVNVLRVSAISALVVTQAGWLDVAHAYLLPITLALTAVAVWLLAERLGPHA